MGLPYVSQVTTSKVKANPRLGNGLLLAVSGVLFLPAEGRSILLLWLADAHMQLHIPVQTPPVPTCSRIRQDLSYIAAFKHLGSGTVSLRHDLPPSARLWIIGPLKVKSFYVNSLFPLSGENTRLVTFCFC